MSSTIVIKAKYGETLRRFNASIHQKKLDLNIVTLREKIRSLFSFDSGVDFTLTYVDEDDDVITLADDADLLDVVRQSLNPLRITVSLNKTKYENSNGNSTPMKSAQNQFPFQGLNSGVSDMLKSVQEPIREVLANLHPSPAMGEVLANLHSSPAIGDLVGKMTAVYMDQVMGNSKVNLANSGSGSGSSNVNSELETVKESKVPVNKEAGSSSLKKKDKQVQNANEGAKFEDVKPPPKGVDLNVPYFQYEPLQKTESSAAENVLRSENKRDGSSGAAVSSHDSLLKLLKGYQKPELDTKTVENVSHDSLLKLLKDQRANQKQELGTQTNTEFKEVLNGENSDWVQRVMNATNQYRLGGMPLPAEAESHGRNPRHPRLSHWKRYSLDNSNSALGNVFHRGVRCDGCGVHPITGSRYKSKVKLDYDLCSVCFAGTRDAADYMKIDQPTNGFRHPNSFRGLPQTYCIPPPTMAHPFRTTSVKPPRSKLDSRFILDVNILDGTIMAPLTAFTKIWRMRNNGSIIWPHGSQLHWIGGDRLSNSHSVDVEIPVDGLPVDQELDIAVDFNAPELPGRYVSYWRMAAPSGQKYGQRVWVLIQVDASMKDLGETSINLNLPPVVSYPETANQDHIKVTESENTSAADSQLNNQEKNFPINDSLIIDSPVTTVFPTVFNTTEVKTALASLPPGPVSSSGFYPTVELDSASYEPINYTAVDFSGVPPVIGGSGPSSPKVTSANKEVNAYKEEALMKDLESIGFKQLDLNKEVLRMNNYDLEKSIDDLCGVSDWDPMLAELQEMGFEDNEANKRLLKKNNGSIKRVVMDLINGEQA